MIESICLLNIATYDPEKSEDIVNLNRKIFFCGANCVGKKTISRSIENAAISADSRMSWLRYSQTLAMAYDNDCIFSNFTDWHSVFTLGKIALAQFDRLDSLKDQRKRHEQMKAKSVVLLGGENGKTGKYSESIFWNKSGQPVLGAR